MIDTDKITKALGVDNLIDIISDDFNLKDISQKTVAKTLSDILENNPSSMKYYSYPDNMNFNDSFIMIYINKNVKDPTTFNNNTKDLYSLKRVNRNGFVPTKADSKINNDYFSNRQGYKRIDKAISLYIPDSISDNIEHNWSSEDTRTAQNVMQFFSDIGDVAGSKQEEMYGKLKGKAKDWGGRAVKATGEFILGSSGKAFYAGEKKQIDNPRTEFLYSSTLPRTFNYSFKFSPANMKELINIYNIIKLLKFHSYSSIGKGETGETTYLNYPSTFDIKYYTGGNINNHFINSTSCALTTISENLSGADEIFSVFDNNLMGETSFKGQDIPTSIILNLTFMELEVLTKERFIELNS